MYDPSNVWTSNMLAVRDGAEYIAVHPALTTVPLVPFMVEYSSVNKSLFKLGPPFGGVVRGEPTRGKLFLM